MYRFMASIIGDGEDTNITPHHHAYLYTLIPNDWVRNHRQHSTILLWRQGSTAYSGGISLKA